MRDYAKVSPQFWTRGSGKRLRGDADAQVLALYLVTCPSANMVGVYYVPFVAIAHETGLGIDRTRAAIKRLTDAEFAFYDEDAELAWVPNMAAYQIGEELKEGDKRRGGPIRAEVEKIGQHRFVVDFWGRYGTGYGLGPCPYDDPSDDSDTEGLASPSEGPPMGDTPQSGRAGEEQEQEQEQERVQGEGSTSEPNQPQALALDLPPEPKTPDPIREVFAYWLRGYRHRHPKAKDRRPTDKERKAIREALGLGYSAEDLKLAVEGLFLSPFHLGENDRRKEFLDVGIAFRPANLESFRESASKRREHREAERKRATEAPVEPEVADAARARRDALTGRFRIPGPDVVPAEGDAPEQAPIAIGGS